MQKVTNCASIEIKRDLFIVKKSKTLRPLKLFNWSSMFFLRKMNGCGFLLSKWIMTSSGPSSMTSSSFRTNVATLLTSSLVISGMKIVLKMLTAHIPMAPIVRIINFQLSKTSESKKMDRVTKTLRTRFTMQMPMLINISFPKIFSVFLIALIKSWHPLMK